VIETFDSNAEILAALSGALIEYGERHRNPVMDILPADEPFQANRKYPESRLRFGRDQWRAYYHSHDVPGPGANDMEHGHFHVFRRIDNTGVVESDWSHVVALGMDRNGQPLRWFTVNNWVTGDHWLPATELEIRIASECDTEPLICRWLCALLGFYQPVIARLLVERDLALSHHQNEKTAVTVLSDREIYFLSEAPIDLLGDLSFALGQ